MKRLMVWTGPVSSAKSTAALGMAHRFQTMGLCVILVRPTCSVREHEECGEFKTKNGMPWLSFEVDMPWQILTKVLEGAGVVWIDEPALFKGNDLDLFNTVNEIRKDCIVMVSGIAATSELEPFGTSAALLLATADEIIQCKGDCPFCAGINNATRSLYMGDAPKDGQALVGGADVYQPVCVHCWNEMIVLPPAERRSWRGRLVRQGCGQISASEADETV